MGGLVEFLPSALSRYVMGSGYNLSSAKEIRHNDQAGVRKGPSFSGSKLENQAGVANAA
jgi:hypothetical protein